MAKPSALAEGISEFLYRAGATRADSATVPGTSPMSFAQWVDEQLRPMREALRDCRPYVETCADDDLPNPAADTLQKVDSSLKICTPAT